MSNPVIPPGLVGFRPVTDITPFTARAGITYQGLLEALREYSTEYLPQYLHDEFEGVQGGFEDAVAELTNAFITGSIPVSDALLNAVLTATTSAARNTLDARYVQEGDWTPGFGGPGANVGASGGTDGFKSRSGRRVELQGHVEFGVTTASWGSHPVLIGCDPYGSLNVMHASGSGFYQEGNVDNTTANPRGYDVALKPYTNNVGVTEFEITTKAANGYNDLINVLRTPPQSSRLTFNIRGHIG